MEKSKPSEDEILKLGKKKLVKELQLDTSVNTLGKWMAHYIAELIDKVENTSLNKEKELIKRECFEVILKLWNNKEHLPSTAKPFKNLKPLLEVLDVLKIDNYASPFWNRYKDIPDNPTWKGFANSIKQNTRSIFELCLYSSIGKELLEESKEWTEEYKTLLSKEELTLLTNLNYLLNGYESLIVFSSKAKEEVNLMELPIEKKV